MPFIFEHAAHFCNQCSGFIGKYLVDALLNKGYCVIGSGRRTAPFPTVFDLAKAERELGYQPVSFEDGIRHTFSAK